MDKLYFSFTDDNNVTHKFEILVTYKMLETGKYYMIYTDNTYDSNGELNAYAAIYDPFDESVFEELQTEEEWELANQYISKLRDE